MTMMMVVIRNPQEKTMTIMSEAGYHTVHTYHDYALSSFMLVCIILNISALEYSHESQIISQYTSCKHIHKIQSFGSYTYLNIYQ